MTNICQKFFTLNTDQETKKYHILRTKNANKKIEKNTNTNTLIIYK